MSTNCNSITNFEVAVTTLVEIQPKIKQSVVLNTAIEILTEEDQSLSNTQLALSKLITYCDNQLNNRFSQIYWAIFPNEQQSTLLAVKESFSDYLKNSTTCPENNIMTSKKALNHFLMQFDNTFKVKSAAMTKPEKILIETMSDRIWNSPNVQAKKSDSEKYQAYHEYMTSYYEGAHFIFEEHSGDSILKELKTKIGFTNDKKDLGRKQLAARVSSHYVRKVGEQDHIHLAGKHVPETVFSEVALPIKNEIIVPGTRYAMNLDIHADKESKIKVKKFFWIQTENNPDGPDWTSYLKHRSIDFVIYVCRKKLGYAHANVGPYGYGPGDKNPIIIRAN